MSQENLSSNLSKIQTQAKDNWSEFLAILARSKVKAGSQLTDIGVSDKEFVNIVTQDEYLNRMYEAFNKTDDPKLKHFCFTQIRNILIQRNIWQ